jgi:hypothetical protein
MLWLFFGLVDIRSKNAQDELSEMVRNVDDQRSKAYALSSAMLVSTINYPEQVDTFEKTRGEAIDLANSTNDIYLKYFTQFVVGWAELHRGRADRSGHAAEELISFGRKMNDARTLGLGTAIKAWVALANDDSVAALRYSEICLDLARAPIDFVNAKSVELCSKILLKRKDAFVLLRGWMERCEAEGWQNQLRIGRHLGGRARTSRRYWPRTPVAGAGNM